MATKQKRQRFTTPAGILVFPWLNKPSTKFNANGEFTTRLALTPEQAADMIEFLDGEVNKALAMYQEDMTTKKFKKVMKPVSPYKQETDDEGEETGRILFAFKLKHKITSKKTGETYEFFPALFDKAGKPLDRNKVKIAAGTTAVVSYEVRPYFAANDKTVGVSLQLAAVQVLELVEWSGGGSAESFGFKAAEEAAEADEDDVTEGEAGEDEDNDEDF